jgi:hypothetical protein
MSTSFYFDREKYIRILKAEGISSALTQLHHDTTEWEHESYEGRKGYQPEMWEALEGVRKFSRELWDLALRSPESPQ